MEPTTLVAIGVGLYFLLTGGSKKDDNDDPVIKPGDCPKGYTRNAQGQCVADGSTVNCAPGLVRGSDGKCRKKIKAKPGTKVDPSDISDVKPDIIASDDAWIAPGCKSLFYGPDFFRKTMVPVVLEYVDAGYGFTPEYYVEGEPLDMGALASTGSVAVIAGMLGTYRPDCAEILEAWNADNVPTQAQVNDFAAKISAAKQAWLDSFGGDAPNGDPALESAYNALQGQDPYIAYAKAKASFLANIPGASKSVRDLAIAILATIESRGYQNLAEELGFDWTFNASEYPARFKPQAEDFA